VKKSKVCVVIPVYKGKGIVDKCIDALLNQTYKPDKIICVDDASPDNSGGYVKEKFPFVKIIKNKINLGSPGAYARGIKYAYKSGFEYVWLLDQDDIPFKDALGNLLKISEKRNSIVFTSTLINPSTHIVYPMLSRRHVDFNNPYVAEVVYFAGMLLHKNLIKKIGYPLRELTMDAGDWEYCLRCKKEGYEICVIPKSRIYHIGGEPKIVKMFITRTHYKLKKDKIEKFSSKYAFTRLDSPERYYTRIKNIILVMKLPYATSFFRKFALKLFFKQFSKIVFYEDEKIEKVNVFLHGIIDGLSKSTN
jgi:rhamnopyranosyl-N-acetylglucosaminyl-diphospho-decaprenol beta-1,3/1,4-galactofuranosyltransferase